MERVRGPKPRGRAASPIRTGRFIRSYLEEKDSAFIGEVHYALKEAWKEINKWRPPLRRVKPPTYESFRKYFAHIVELRLVELDREEPMELPPPGAPLLSIRDHLLVVSRRRYFRLSEKGLVAVEEWDDPMLALGYRG